MKPSEICKILKEKYENELNEIRDNINTTEAEKDICCIEAEIFDSLSENDVYFKEQHDALITKSKKLNEETKRLDTEKGRTQKIIDEIDKKIKYLES